MEKQDDRFVGIEYIDGHRSSQLVPPRVAGGDEHLPLTAGQKRRQQLRNDLPDRLRDTAHRHQRRLTLTKPVHGQGPHQTEGVI